MQPKSPAAGPAVVCEPTNDTRHNVSVVVFGHNTGDNLRTIWPQHRRQVENHLVTTQETTLEPFRHNTGDNFRTF